MCTEDVSYNLFPARILGGGDGNYFLRTPVDSKRWCEYAVLAIANGDAGPSTVFITGGNQVTKTIPFDASITLSDDTFFTGMLFHVPSGGLPPMYPLWQRVTNSEGKVFVRIDAPDSTSVYVTIAFRDKLVTVVPGPALTVHPDMMQQMHIAREEKTTERLKAMGIPYEVEHSHGR